MIDPLSISLLSMEYLLFSFKGATRFFPVENAIQYAAVEAGKGEFGVLLAIFNARIARLHFRSPAFNHLQSLANLGCGHYLADIVTLIGSLDIVFGEVDR